MTNTGIQAFWSYDTFSLLGPMAGRSQAEAIGLLNTFNFNLCFTQTDIALKFHDNPPILTRTYNSSDDDEDIYFINGGVNNVSFIGKNWMLNFEHCLVEETDEGDPVTLYEIDPTGCRNEYTWDTDHYNVPAGVFKEVTRNDDSGIVTLELTTRDYVTYHFSEKVNRTNMTTNCKFYGLDWIMDRNGNKVIIEWNAEDETATYITCIKVGSDGREAEAEVIQFQYTNFIEGEETVRLISSYEVVKPASPTNGFQTQKWYLNYDNEEQTHYYNLVKVIYPKGGLGGSQPLDNECAYEFGHTVGILSEILDMNKVKWTFAWTSGPPATFTRKIYGPDEVSEFSTFEYVYTSATKTTTLESPVFPNRFWDYVHDQDGRLIERRDPFDNDYAYQWGTAGGKWVLSMFTFPSEDYVNFTYDANACLTDITWGTHTTDAQKRLSVKYTWGTGDEKYLVTSIAVDEATDSPDWWSTTEFTYTDKNLQSLHAGIAPSGATDPDVRIVIQFEYTEYGNVSVITDPEGVQTKYTYSEELNETKGTGFGALRSTEIENVTKYFDWTQLETLMTGVKSAPDASYKNPFITYSARGEVLKYCSQSGAIILSTEYTYDKMSNPITISGNGSDTTYNYDLSNCPLNVPVEIIIPGGHGVANTKIVFAYDKWGDRTLKTFYYNGNPYKTEYVYDYARRLRTVNYQTDSGTTYQEGTTYIYGTPGSDNGLITEIQRTQDTETDTTHVFEYNFAGQLTKTTYWAGTSEDNYEEYTYEGPKSMVSQIDRVWSDGSTQTATWTYEYDRLGRCVKWTKPTVPGGSTQTFTTEYYYDRNSRLFHIKHTRDLFDDPTHEYSYRHEKYVYDKLGRLTRIYREVDENITTDVGRAYDQDGNLVQTTSGGLVTAQMKYDGLNRLVARYTPGDDPETQSERYDYGCNGKIAAVHNKDGQVWLYKYDPAGRIASITDPVGRIYRREYWENGWLKRMIYPSGDFIGYEYDGFGRIIRVWETIPDEYHNPTVLASNPWDWNSSKIAITLEIEYGYESDLKRTVTYSTVYSSTGSPNYNLEYYVTMYTYHRLSWLEKVSFPTEGSTTTPGTIPDVYLYEYNYRGNLKYVKLNDTTVRTLITNTFDVLGRNLTHNYSDFAEPAGQGGAPSCDITNEFTYCCCSVLKAEQTTNTSAYPKRTLEYTRDKRHRLLQEKYTDAWQNTVIDPKEYDYEWDNASRLIKFTDPVYGANPSDPKPTSYSRSDNTKTFELERIDTSDPVKSNAETYHYEFDTNGRVKKLMMPDWENLSDEGFNAYVLSVEYDYYPDGRVSSIGVKDLVNDNYIYYLDYTYDLNGRMVAETVKNQKIGRAFVFRTRYGFDSRGQLLNQYFEKYYSTGDKVAELWSSECTYDLAGNPKTRTTKDGTYIWDYTYTYDTGYRLTDLVVTVSDHVITLLSTTTTDWSYTYEFNYDLRGNMISCDVTIQGTPPVGYRPVDLPDVMEYDSHNQLSRYEITGERQVKLYMDPVGRVFRKEEYNGSDPNWVLVSATHYYYKGGALMQEFDEMIDVITHRPKNQIQWDYLRGADGRVIRKRNHDTEADTDTLHITSPVGSTMDVFSPDATTFSTTSNGYIRNAEGEPVEYVEPVNLTLNNDVNHIQYHGGFVEDKNMHETSPTVEKRMFYRMGVRHYSTSLGRFMQRDPITFMREPGKMQPLSCNPYIYAHNNPVQMSDISGYAPMGSGTGGCGNCGDVGFVPPPPELHPSEITPESEEKGRECAFRWPKECVSDPTYPNCTRICCQFKDEIDRTASCCSTINQLDFYGIYCETTSEGLCGCACCWAGQDDNSPSLSQQACGSSASGGGAITYFGPGIGLWDDGSYPWDILPFPIIPVGMFGVKKSNKPIYMGADMVKFPPTTSLLGSIFGPAAPWAIGGTAAVAVGTGLSEFCDKAIKNAVTGYQDENAFWKCSWVKNCICQACQEYNECWNKFGRWAAYGGLILALILNPIAAGFAVGFSILSLAICLKRAWSRYLKCAADFGITYW
jgi:RHS repeat-associated protein